MKNIAACAARFNELPIRNLGASNCKKAHVEIKPPMLPIIALKPMAEERAVSETTFAEQ